MIYVLFNFTQERWLLLGDYPTEVDLVEYLDTLVNSPCFKRNTLAAYRIGDFSDVDGSINPVPRVRVWDYYPPVSIPDGPDAREWIHIPDDSEGVSCRGASSPPEVVPDPQDPPTKCVDQPCCFVESKRFFSRLNPFKSKKEKE